MRACSGKDVRRTIVARLGDEAADAIDEFLALALAHEGAYPASLENFLDWFEKGASDVKRDMEEGGGKVRVMTVHGAKGLEAHIVIIPDTTQIPDQARRAGLLYTEDCVFYNVPGRIDVPPVAAAKDAAHAREMREYRRLLYVALTRARDWLVIAGYEMKRPTIHEQSWYPALEAAAKAMGATADANGVLALGDEPGTGPVETAAQIQRAPAPDFLARPAPKEPAATRILRPSDAAGEEEPALISPLVDQGKRFRRGLLIHALLAALPNTAPQARHSVAMAYLAREGAAADDAAAMAREALAVIDHPDFAPVFAPGSRAEVPVIADLSELGPGARVNGQIDRLAVTADTVLIADFKTNRPPPKTPEATPAVYRAQMALYRAALAKIYPGKPNFVRPDLDRRAPPDAPARCPAGRGTGRSRNVWWTSQRLESERYASTRFLDPRGARSYIRTQPSSEAAMPIKVTDTSFQKDVLEAGKPVVVDFWAEWCGPCRMIAPALEELSTELGAKVTVAKINIDENPQVPMKYGVRGIPTLMIFHNGQVAATKVGALPKTKIKEWIEASIPSSDQPLSANTLPAR